MTTKQTALIDRAYGRIGACSCPPVAVLCVNCEVLRDLIAEIERLQELVSDVSEVAVQRGQRLDVIDSSVSGSGGRSRDE